MLRGHCREVEKIVIPAHWAAEPTPPCFELSSEAGTQWKVTSTSLHFLINRSVFQEAGHHGCFSSSCIFNSILQFVRYTGQMVSRPDCS